MVITVGLREPGLDCVPLLKILDLNTGTTIDTFADKVDYAVPHYVVADIGGGYVDPPPTPGAPTILTICSGSGGATVTQPVGGYVDGLEVVIGAPPRESPTCSNGQQHDCGRNHHGAIIGGAVAAGVVGLGLGLVMLWLWRRRAGSDTPERNGPEIQELPDPGPELQSWEDGMMTSAQEMPHPVQELQSREDEMQTSAHELPGVGAPARFVVPDPKLMV